MVIDPNWRALRAFSLAFVLGITTLGLAACDDSGPAEEAGSDAGEAVDDAVEATSETVQEAADDAAAAAEDAGEAAGEAAEEADAIVRDAAD